MYILSFDIGIHNFSFSLIKFEKEKQSYDIHYFENKDLAPSKKIDKSFHITQRFLHDFHQYLRTKHDIIGMATICLIEKQLTKKNIKASSLYSHLETHLIIFFSSMKIIGFSPRNKYLPFQHLQSNDHAGKSTYRERKKWGVNVCQQLLQHSNDEVALGWLDTYQKKDDICDTIISTLQYLILNKLLIEKI